MGVVVHEMSHGFGLPDLYDTSGQLPIGGVGKFGNMASMQGWDYRPQTPGHLCAYSRMKIGWVDPMEIDRDGYYVAQPLEIANSVYKIKHGYPEGEYLLIENKQSIKWDSDVKQGGLVIYHVDENARRQSDRGYPGGPGWPAKHYKVAIVQADGNFDIEKGKNFGDAGDFWIQGSSLQSGGAHPNTDSYQSGVLKPTGVSIDVLSDSGFIMMFRVSGIGSRSASVRDKGEGLLGDLNGTADHEQQQPSISLRDGSDSTGQTLEWILSMLLGVGIMLGLAMVVFL